jgi:hypothetical protein
VTRFNKHYVWFVGLAIIYLLLVLCIPPNASVLLKYGLSPAQARLLSLSVALPVIGIWFVAFYGYIAFKRYTAVVASSKDGQALAKISDALTVLAWSLPVSTLINTGLNYVATQHEWFTPASIIVNNYVALLFLWVGFYILYGGAKELYGQVRKNTLYTLREQVVWVAFSIFCVTYAYMTLVNPARQFPTAVATHAAYYMSDLPLILTIIIPYIFVWYFGLRSVYFLSIYREKVQGLLYKRALAALASGLATVIITSMLLRLLTAFTTLINTWTLRVLLMVLYLLVLIIAIGYILIALGAKRLNKIEEV